MTAFPEIPLDAWRPTKNTLHLYLQIIGKIRLKLHPRINHWWHVTLYVTPRGLTTRAIPHDGGSFEIALDLRDHRLVMTSSDGGEEDFALYDGLSVADFYASVMANLTKLGIDPHINAIPYEAPSTTPFADDNENKSYDKKYVELFHEVLVAVDDVMEEFRGRFTGKSTPVHMFWHSFDLALTRFSGKAAPPMPEANLVTREAYSHEVISFGFWFGDDNVPAPAFYSYTAPEPKGLTDEPLRPDTAFWNTAKGAMALLMYDDVRQAANPRETALAFLESAYLAGANRARLGHRQFQAPSVMNIEQLRKFCLAFPGATEDIKWGSDLCFCVGAKMFCVTSVNAADSGISLKCTPEKFAELTEREGIDPAAYVGRYKWVHIAKLDAAAPAELKSLIEKSYQLVFDKLPPKIKKTIT